MVDAHAQSVNTGPVVAISCVRDEQDMIEAFVRHTLAVADRLLLLDNGSTDATPDILDRLIAEGLPLEVRPDPSLGCWQWRRMTGLMREAAGRMGAAWVLPLDADELLVARGGRSGLRTFLARAPGPVHVPMISYVATSMDDAAERHPARRIRHRLRTEARWCKALVPARIAGLADAFLAQGNHFVEIGGAPCPGEEVLEDQLHLAHFPARTPEQLGAKVATHRLQYLAMTARGEGWGSHYDHPYGALKGDWASFEAMAPEVMARNVAVPGDDGRLALIDAPAPYLGGPLRYTPPPGCGAHAVLSRLLSYAEQLAAGHADRCREVEALSAERDGLLAENVRLAERLALESRRERQPIHRALRAVWRRVRQ